MSKKWLKRYMVGADALDTLDTLNTGNIETESSFISTRETEQMTTDAKYTIKLIAGRKVYEDDSRQLPVWSAKQCDERMQQLNASDENHADFWMKMAKWALEEKVADEMESLWASDCLAALHEAYERAEQKILETKTEKAEEAPVQLAKPAEDKPKAKLFGSPRPPEKPRLFTRK